MNKTVLALFMGASVAAQDPTQMPPSSEMPPPPSSSQMQQSQYPYSGYSSQMPPPYDPSMQQPGGYPPPPPQGSYPPPQGSYHPQGSYPPPPPQGSYPPPQGSYPPPQGSYPPPQNTGPDGSTNSQWGPSGGMAVGTFDPAMNYAPLDSIIQSTMPQPDPSTGALGVDPSMAPPPMPNYGYAPPPSNYDANQDMSYQSFGQQPPSPYGYPPQAPYGQPPQAPYGQNPYAQQASYQAPMSCPPGQFPNQYSSMCIDAAGQPDMYRPSYMPPPPSEYPQGIAPPSEYPQGFAPPQGTPDQWGAGIPQPPTENKYYSVDTDFSALPSSVPPQQVQGQQSFPMDQQMNYQEIMATFTPEMMNGMSQTPYPSQGSYPTNPYPTGGYPPMQQPTDTSGWGQMPPMSQQGYPQQPYDPAMMQQGYPQQPYAPSPFAPSGNGSFNQAYPTNIPYGQASESNPYSTGPSYPADQYQYNPYGASTGGYPTNPYSTGGYPSQPPMPQSSQSGYPMPPNSSQYPPQSQGYAPPPMSSTGNYGYAPTMPNSSAGGIPSYPTMPVPQAAPVNTKAPTVASLFAAAGHF